VVLLVAVTAGATVAATATMGALGLGSSAHQLSDLRRFLSPVLRYLDIGKVKKLVVFKAKKAKEKIKFLGDYDAVNPREFLLSTVIPLCVPKVFLLQSNDHLVKNFRARLFEAFRLHHRYFAALDKKATPARKGTSSIQLVATQTTLMSKKMAYLRTRIVKQTSIQGRALLIRSPFLFYLFDYFFALLFIRPFNILCFFLSI
jgi:hypothetical protein